MTLATDLSGPCSWDIRTTREELAAGRISHVEHVDALLERLPVAEELGAVISADPELVRAMAHALDRGGETPGPLTGVPLAVKDAVDVAGFPTTGGTRALADHVVDRDALAVDRLREAGALLALKTNLHELCLGITSNNRAFGAVHHPVDPALAAGGSSGGSAVAVAVGLVPAAVAAGTGGSARLPAALCGIVGFRPTRGRYPSSGVLPAAHSRDSIGPVARTVDDVVLLDAVLTGEHPHRAPGARVLEYDDEGPGPLHGVRLGVPELFLRDLEPGVDAVFGAALRALEAAGAELVEVDVRPARDLAASAGMTITLHEFLPDLQEYLDAGGGGHSLEQVREGIAGTDVRRIWDLAEVFRAADDDYRAAQEERRLARRLYAGALEAKGVTALVQPTCPLTARPVGDDETVELNGRRVPTYETFTRHTDLAGVLGTPGISLPAGRTAPGLPVGLELAGNPGTDAVLLELARTVEALLRDQ